MTTDPSSDVLERVIRAVADKQRELCDPPYYSEEIARAAIAAMPTIERLSAELGRVKGALREANEIGCTYWCGITHTSLCTDQRAALSNTAENG